ncbi:hypothetical protein ES702_01426 [subsurface metagenome]
MDVQQVDFQLKPTTKKPARRYRKGSKYDPLLDAFIKGDNKLTTVTVKDKDSNYIRTQLKKRIDARELKVIVSVVNDICYLEKTPEPKKVEKASDAKKVEKAVLKKETTSS